MAGGTPQEVACLPPKCEALSSEPSTAVAGYSSRVKEHQGFSGSNIYYRAGSGSADSHPKAEP
jgi:hypothetical protein